MDKTDKKFKPLLIVVILIAFIVMVLIPLLISYFINYPFNGPSQFDDVKKIKNNMENFINETLKEKYPSSIYKNGNIKNMTYKDNDVSFLYEADLESNHHMLNIRYSLINSFAIEKLLNNVLLGEFNDFKNASFSLYSFYQHKDDDLLSSNYFQNYYPDIKVSKLYVYSLSEDTIKDKYFYASFIGNDQNNKVTSVDMFQYDKDSKEKYPNDLYVESNVTDINSKYYNLLAYLTNK